MNCSICYEDIVPQNAFRISGCGHEFCRDCLVPWTRRNASCPNCRGSLSDDEKSDLNPVEMVTLTLRKVYPWDKDDPFHNHVSELVTRYRHERYSGLLPVRAFYRVDHEMWARECDEYKVEVLSTHRFAIEYGTKPIYVVEE
jgi:hypothetical protein